MHALQFEQTGDPRFVLKYRELPDPIPASDEVLVEVDTAGINPSDIKNVQGNFAKTRLPRIQGRDFAGIVRQGPANTIGKEVWGTGGDVGITRDGSHAQFIVIPLAAVSSKPENITLTDAATVGVSYITAWQALISSGQLQKGESVIIIGANGSVGRAAIQIAHWKGARVIGTVRDAKYKQDVINAGADICINTGDENAQEALLTATNGHGANLVFDTVGGRMFEFGLRVLAEKGRQLVIASTEARRVTFDLIDFYHHEARLIGIDSMKLNITDASSLLEQMRPGFESGDFKSLPIAQHYPLEKGVEAYIASMNDNRSGKTMLCMK
jgi:NADPH:quinone reductase-like Zn-dependent oxidoreductase